MPFFSLYCIKYITGTWGLRNLIRITTNIGFDVGELSEDGPDDWEGLDASAAHIGNLLSTEPPDGTLKGKNVCKINMHLLFHSTSYNFMIKSCV